MLRVDSGSPSMAASMTSDTSRSIADGLLLRAVEHEVRGLLVGIGLEVQAPDAARPERGGGRQPWRPARG